MKRWLVAAFALIVSMNVYAVTDATETGSKDCENSHALENIMTTVCWSCVTPMRIMGVGGEPPSGAAPNKPACYCMDKNNVPALGWQLGYFQPARVEEVVRVPYCSPFLGGVKLQDTTFDMGIEQSSPNRGSMDIGFMDSHFFAYPLMQMLNLLLIPDCAGDSYVDLDLLSVTEIDPMWSSDLLSFLLNPESVVFANPLTLAWCAADCVVTTAGHASEVNYFCAGCDGMLYPFTGNVAGAGDPVRSSSLILQRQLASLHRKGLALKTMGEDQMCGATYSWFIPKSQYKVSMLYPVPEATNTLIPTTKSNPTPDPDSPTSYVLASNCCHRLGESVHTWSTLKGGRTRPGKENYVYLIWRYVDCCVLYKGF